MTTRHTLFAAALVAGLGLAGGAGAQDYFQQRGDRALEGSTVSLRWTVPLGDRADRDGAPKLALRFSQAGAEGDLRGVDLATYSFGEDRKLTSPLYAGGGVGGWIVQHPWLSLAGGGLIIWGVVEATQDDENPPHNTCSLPGQGMPLPGGGGSVC